MKTAFLVAHTFAIVLASILLFIAISSGGIATDLINATWALGVLMLGTSAGMTFGRILNQ
jgi:hypothetical protein